MRSVAVGVSLGAGGVASGTARWCSGAWSMGVLGGGGVLGRRNDRENG